MTSDNVFQIDSPEQWWCRISSLASAHTVMRIDVIKLRDNDRVSDFSEVFPLEFRKVAYFSGWMTWVGADFRIAAEVDKLRFLRSVQSVDPPVSDEQLSASYEFRDLQLFTVQATEGIQIRILANAACRLDKHNKLIIGVP